MAKKIKQYASYHTMTTRELFHLVGGSQWREDFYALAGCMEPASIHDLTTRTLSCYVRAHAPNEQAAAREEMLDALTEAFTSHPQDVECALAEVAGRYYTKMRRLDREKNPDSAVDRMVFAPLCVHLSTTTRRAFERGKTTERLSTNPQEARKQRLGFS